MQLHCHQAGQVRSSAVSAWHNLSSAWVGTCTLIKRCLELCVHIQGWKKCSRCMALHSGELQDIACPCTAERCKRLRSVSLSTTMYIGLPSDVLLEMNKVVEATLKRNGSRKRKYTTTFTAKDRAKIGKYAAENGNAVADKVWERALCKYSRRSILMSSSKRAQIQQ